MTNMRSTAPPTTVPAMAAGLRAGSSDWAVEIGDETKLSDEGGAAACVVEKPSSSRTILTGTLVMAVASEGGHVKAERCENVLVVSLVRVTDCFAKVLAAGLGVRVFTVEVLVSFRSTVSLELPILCYRLTDLGHDKLCGYTDHWSLHKIPLPITEEPRLRLDGRVVKSALKSECGDEVSNKSALISSSDNATHLFDPRLIGSFSKGRP